LKSTDGGENWENTCPEKFKNLDFRGISVLNKDQIIAMSSGDGSEGKALIIKTLDGGKTWTEILKKTEKGVFFDTIKFKNAKVGFILGDPIDQQPYILKTSDGGKTWFRIENLPDILVGEASFAASNSCLSIFEKNVWFNTQNRVFHSKNLGKTWEVIETPFETAQTRGIFGNFYLNKKEGFLVGGDYQNDKIPTLQISKTVNQGQFFDNLQENNLKGLTECLAKIDSNKYIAVGTHGTSVSINAGNQWNKIDNASFHTVACKNKKCIAAGANGQIGLMDFK
jgi:photosystem II stability/assembly factor-like uncharacterized protein